MNKTARLEYKQLLEKSKIIWEQKWKDSDVLVEGCQKLQDSLGFRFIIYLDVAEKRKNVFRYARKDLPARHIMEDIFWDSEMYLLPFYLYTDRYRRKV